MICTLLGLTAGLAEAQQGPGTPATAPEAAILPLMLVDITQASDIVRGIEDPQTDEEWQAIDDAAVALLEAFRTIAARDVDAAFDAGDSLYLPCEGCHLDYNRAVQGQPQQSRAVLAASSVCRDRIFPTAAE